MRFELVDDIANGRLGQVLSEIELKAATVHRLRPFGRRLPARARLFVDFLLERIKHSVQGFV